MKVVISPLAKKQFRKLPKLIQFSLTRKIRSLVDDEELTGVKPLIKFKGVYRIRVGDYRMVYKKFTDKYFVILVEHRRSVYESLKRIWK